MQTNALTLPQSAPEWHWPFSKKGVSGAKLSGRQATTVEPGALYGRLRMSENEKEKEKIKVFFAKCPRCDWFVSSGDPVRSRYEAHMILCRIVRRGR